MDARRSLWLLLRAGLFLGALWYLASWLDIHNLLAMAGSASPLNLLLTFACVLLTHLLRGLRLRQSAAATGQQVTVLRAFAIYAISAFWGRVTPGKLGELARVGYFEDKARLFPYILLERVFDVAAIALLAAPLITLLAAPAHLAALAAVAAFITLLLVKPLRMRLYAVLERLIKLPENSGRFLARMGALSLFSWLASLSALFFAATATGISIELTVFLPVAAAAVAVGIVSGTPGGFGTREAILAYLLSLTAGLDLATTSVLAVYAIIAVTLSEFILFLAGNLLLVRDQS